MDRKRKELMNDNIPAIKLHCFKCGKLTDISIFNACYAICLECVAKLDTLEKIKEEVKKGYLNSN